MIEHRDLLSSCLLRHARGLRVFAFLALAATACGSESTTGDPGGGGAAGGSGGSGGSGAGQTTGQGGSGGQATTTGEGGEQTTTGQGGGGGMPQPEILSCFFQCESVTDCYSAGAPPTVDADNWTCENSFCVYKGCNSTQECIDTYGENANLTCKAYPGSTLKGCQLDCSSAADCSSAGAPPAVDADNYACENGFCIYKGCNSTQECVDAYGSDFICSEGP